VRLTTLPPSCAVVMKSRNLNFLEPSEPLRACNGTDLPFYTQHIRQYKACKEIKLKWPKRVACSILSFVLCVTDLEKIC